MKPVPRESGRAGAPPSRTAPVVDVLTRFEQQVRTAPERTALAIGGEVLTYGQLHARSSALARRIASAADIRPGAGQVVALHLRQSAGTVVGMLAALRLGAAWYVVEPDAHAAGPDAERVRTLLAGTGCAAVVFDGADPATAPDAVAAVAPGAPRLDLSRPDATVASGAGVPARVPGAAPAYVIGTAGSTGAPKAVVVSRDAFAQLMAARGEEPGVTAFSPCRLAWDGALLLLFHALCTGGTAVLPDARELPDAARSAALIGTWQVRLAAAPPSFYRLMLPHLAGAARHLRAVILGGEPVPATLVEAHRRTLPGTRLTNEYGPTETTVGVLAHTVPDAPGAAVTDTAVPDTAVPIGRPIGPVTRVYVLGRDLRPVADGALGELYIGGPQVALGYAGRPGETASRFVADPYAAVPGARMYRTGDLARVTASGAIGFAGREDGQVKVRGTRIERHAVEAAVESRPGVGRACVLAVPDERTGDILVAFWTAAPDTDAPTVRELLAHCASRLAAHAVPEHFVQVADIPLTPQGKTDETALRALFARSGPAGPGDGTADRSGTGVEQQIAALWAEVLRHDGFGPGDSFFSAGGNSRRVVELHMGLERRWPGAVRVGQLFDLVTVRDQAEAVGRALAAGGDGPAGAPAAFEV
ncbi:AMP-binding protein [Streptomyces sp. NPDC018019]|uniref:non-ribosomal peptide synthetase n=1 Tax=Streptomyces sp. NPDC018019 TaxID=3365030 RepID=UPI00379E8D6F